MMLSIFSLDLLAFLVFPILSTLYSVGDSVALTACKEMTVAS